MAPINLPTSDLATIVSPLTGCTQSPCTSTYLINTEYSIVFTAWIAGGGLTALAANYAAGTCPAAGGVLDQLVQGLTTATGTALAAINTTNVFVRVAALASANQPLGFKCYSTSAPTTLLNTPVQTVSPYVEKVFSATDGSGAQILSRSHLSDLFEITVYVILTPSLAFTCLPICPTPNPPNPPAPSPTFLCLPDTDEDSDSDCSNAYGYSWGVPYPVCNSTEGWGLL